MLEVLHSCFGSTSTWEGSMVSHSHVLEKILDPYDSAPFGVAPVAVRDGQERDNVESERRSVQRQMKKVRNCSCEIPG